VKPTCFVHSRAGHEGLDWIDILRSASGVVRQNVERCYDSDEREVITEEWDDCRAAVQTAQRREGPRIKSNSHALDLLSLLSLLPDGISESELV
jgi:hypothetical protein